MIIPEQAVAAALEAFFDVSRSLDENMRAALEAAQPLMGVQQTPDAPMPFPHDRRLAEPDMTDVQIQEWISACNHEPARRVLRAYLLLRDELRRPHTGQPQEGRAAIIEECAKVADDFAYVEMCADETMRGHVNAQPFIKIAKAIRALSAAPASPRAEGAEREVKHLQGFVDFVNLWVTRDNVTDEERVSVIKHHPTASERRKPLVADQRPEVK